MALENLHILVIASWYKSGKDPVGGSFIEEQARMLLRRGHQVTLVHPYLKGTFMETLRNRKTITTIENDNGLTTIRIGVAPVLPSFRQLAYDKLSKTVLTELDRHFKQQTHPDVIHSHSMFMAGVIGQQLAKNWNIPQFHTEHTSGMIFHPEQYTKRDIELTGLVYDSCRTVYFVSDFFMARIKELHKFGLKNATVLPNIVASEFFNEPLHPEVDPKKVICIGNFIPVKQHELLLQAWKIVTSHLPQANLTLVGEGPEQEGLAELASQLGIENSVTWLPRQSRQSVLQLIIQHGIVASSSRIETFGLTIAEATACGRPVVATDSGGVRDIINNTNGILTEQTSESLASGIITCMENYKDYKPELIRQDSLSRFSELHIGKILESEYRRSP